MAKATAINLTEVTHAVVPGMNNRLLPLPMIIAGLVGILVNTIQLVHLLRNIQSTAFNKTLISLCISDLLSCLSFITNGVASILESHLAVLCTFTAMNVFVAGSLFHLIFIGSQRFVAVTFPLKVNRMYSTTRCALLLCFVWIAALVYGAIVSHVFTNDSPWMNSIGVFATGATLFALYIGIGIKIRQRSQAKLKIQQCDQIVRQNNLVLVHSACVTTAFVLSYFPFAVEVLYMPINLEPNYISHSLMAFNPVMNSLVYFSVQCHRHRQLVKNPRRISFKQQNEMHSVVRRTEKL